MSVLILPEKTKLPFNLITPAAACAVYDALKRIGICDIKIKWVNDILKNGKKVCGILSEASFNSSGGAEYVILGIGMNLKAPSDGYPAEIKNIAGSIFEENEELNANALVADTVNEFFTLYNDLYSKNIPNEYKKRMMLMGDDINYTVNSTKKSGRVVGLDDRFHIIVENEAGEREALQSGEVTIGSGKV
jgi:BirA family biotin operon repressor/biotin-[acetyl-CoA-carboxylase] ligase